MDLKDSKTFANLMAAFAGESQARNKYTFYANKAREDGYVQMAEIFEETANNERAHAEMWFKLINQGIGETVGNLEDAAGGEHYEWSDMYPQFAQIAREEGFSHIAKLFDGVSEIEKAHEERFRKLISDLNGNTVFSKDGDAVWQCINCGHIHIGKQVPEVCPVCAYPQAYFEIKKDNY